MPKSVTILRLLHRTTYLAT